MERLGARDLRRILEFWRDLSEVEEPADFPVRALDGLAKLIPCEILSYNEIDLAQQRALTIYQPVGTIPPHAQETFRRLAGQNPLIIHYAATADPRPLKISDFLKREQFHRLDLYQEFYRPYQVEYQLAVTIPAPCHLVIGIAFNRSQRDFSERDRAVLDLIRPQLVHEYTVVAERTRLRALLASLGQKEEDPIARLTRREAEVLARVAQGKTNRDVAAHLGISPRTVQKHLENIFAKLGQHSRTGAAVALASQRLRSAEELVHATPEAGEGRLGVDLGVAAQFRASATRPPDHDPPTGRTEQPDDAGPGCEPFVDLLQDVVSRIARRDDLDDEVGSTLEWPDR